MDTKALEKKKNEALELIGVRKPGKNSGSTGNSNTYNKDFQRKKSEALELLGITKKEDVENE